MNIHGYRINQSLSKTNCTTGSPQLGGRRRRGIKADAHTICNQRDHCARGRDDVTQCGKMRHLARARAFSN